MSALTSEFIPYELALRMKQFGFDEPCFRYYWERFENTPSLMNQYGTPKSNSILDELAKTELKGLQGKSYCAAPLYQQAFRWFREKYQLHSTITSISQESWQWHITKPEESLGKLYDEDFYTYEEAELACLEKLIEIVEQKQKEI